MDYAAFKTRIREKHGLASAQARARRRYPEEMLRAVEDLHLKDGVNLRQIALSLLEEDAWKNHTYAAIHVKLCRHFKKLAQTTPPPLVKKSSTRKRPRDATTPQ